MQLINTTYRKALFLLLILMISSINEIRAQQSTSIDSMKIAPFKDEIEANFLSGYYQQDGNNAAVTGGIGTEELTDISNIFILNIPIDSTKAIGFYAGADIYTSASTDNIDNNISSASSKDTRFYSTISFTKLNLVKGESFSYKIGFSKEYDYQSISGGLSYTKSWNEGNSEISLIGQAFFDNWSIIFPTELRGSVELPRKDRQSYNGQFLFSRVVNKKMQISLSSEVIYMTGLLSTPFHRVYFSDSDTHDIERLPESRIKIPLSARMNIYPFENVVIRSYYRFYWDDFGIMGNTFQLEIPIKVHETVTLSPFYRYHTQTESDYFAPFEENLSTDEFYSSDYDLSGLSSHKYGMGIKIYPLFGIARFRAMGDKHKVLMFKYFELRGALYARSTGLDAYMISANLAFGLK